MTRVALFNAMEQGKKVVYAAVDKEEYYIVNNINQSHVFLMKTPCIEGGGSTPIHNDNIGMIDKSPPESACQRLIQIHDKAVQCDGVSNELYEFINDFKERLERMF